MGKILASCQPFAKFAKFFPLQNFPTYGITGSEQQHFEIRTAIIYHMLSYPHLFISNGADGLPNCITLHSHPRHYNSVEEYILHTRMDQETIWGTNVEMACLVMLNSPIYCYDASQRHHIWAAYFPNNVDRSIPVDIGQRSLYIYFSNSRFQVVITGKTALCRGARNDAKQSPLH